MGDKNPSGNPSGHSITGQPLSTLAGIYPAGIAPCTSSRALSTMLRQELMTQGRFGMVPEATNRSAQFSGNPTGMCR
jgi:hypothetical protein